MAKKSNIKRIDFEMGIVDSNGNDTGKIREEVSVLFNSSVISEEKVRYLIETDKYEYDERLIVTTPTHANNLRNKAAGPKLSMFVRFQIFKKEGKKFSILGEKDVKSVSIGGYNFFVDGKDIPFDWDAFSGDGNPLCFEFETGYGLFDDFRLSDCYDKDYERLNIPRSKITAKFLASVTKINEFCVNFVDKDNNEYTLGCDKNDENIKLMIVRLSFTDMNTNMTYLANQDAIDEFNERMGE